MTEEFIHIMTRALFESMFEVVRHKMTKEKARKYMHMLERYHYGGWNSIFQFDKEGKMVAYPGQQESNLFLKVWVS